MARIPEGVFRNWSDKDRVEAAIYKTEQEAIRTAINDSQDQIDDLKNASVLGSDGVNQVIDQRKNTPSGVIGIDEDGWAYTNMFYDFINGRPFDDTIDDFYGKIDSKSRGKVNVAEFNAQGDKTANDTPALQAALDKAKLKVLTNGIKVTVPQGVYRMTDRLYLTQNTHIVFEEGAVLFRDHSAGFFANGKSGDVFERYEGNGNITIEGGIFEGNLTGRNNSFNALGLARGRNIIVRGVTFRDVRGAHAIDINACKDMIIEKCRFEGYNADYTTIGDNASNFREAIQISNHTEEGFNLFGSWDGTPCENITVKNCYFGPSETQPAYPTGVGNHGHIAGKWNAGIRVYDNMFDGCSWAGIRPYKFNDMWIERNQFLNCSYGVRFSNYDGLGSTGGNPEAGKNLTIKDNHFSGTKVRDIYLAAWEKAGYVSRFKNVKILDNISEGIASTEFAYLQFCDNVQIRGNIVDTGYRFLWSAYNTDITVFGNDVENIVTEFVYILEADAALQNKGYSKRAFVNNNSVQKVGRTAILISCAIDEFEVMFNDIKDATTETVGTRSAINASTNAKNGRIMHNKVRGINQKYGIEVTASCTNVHTHNNDAVGTIKPQINNSVGGFDGYYIYSPDGSRFKVTVTNAGALVCTAG